MPNRQFVRICPPKSVEGVDLELPADESVRLLLPDVLKVMDQPSWQNGKRLHYALRTEEDELLDEKKSLAESGIENFQTLWLTVLENKAEDADGGDSEKTAVMHAESPASQKMSPAPDLPLGLRGVMSPTLWSQLPIEAPSLVSPDGIIFELGEPPILVGRFSKDSTPTIDLTELDREAVSSRRHVEINVVNGEYILTALKTTNGTFVNGVKLNPEEKVFLKDGDSILFGFGGVKMVFCLPHK